MKLSLLSIALISVLSFPSIVIAQLINPLRAEDFPELINLIISFLWTFGIILGVLVVIMGAFYMATSFGDPKKFDTGKKVIFYAIAGLIIIVLARGLIEIILDLVT